MTIRYSSQLGWTAGQDVSAKFASLVKSTFKAGDTFVLDHMYKMSGSFLKLPDGFTLSAKSGGGFQILDGATSNNYLLELGHRNTIDNVTITHSGLPPAGNMHKKTFKIVDKDDVHITNCKFVGKTGIDLDVYGGDRLTIKSSYFEGAYAPVRVTGNNLDTWVDHSVFKGAMIDGIKTILDARGIGVQRFKVTNSVFENNARDGIDTAGGFKDSTVSNSIFRKNGVSGIDIKTVLEGPEDLNVSNMNKNITITNSQFTNNRDAVVFTTYDGAHLLNNSNASQWSVQHVYVRDSIVEKTSNHVGDVRTFLIKDSHDIYWTNIKVLGAVTKEKIWHDPELNATLNYKLVGTNTTYGAPRPASTSYPFEVGPDADATQLSLALAPDPDPTSQPEPTPDPASHPTVDSVFIYPGDTEFTGQTSDIVNLPHFEALEIDQGSIAFSFDATRIDLRQGLLSKDATGYTGGGNHFSAWVEHGALYVRFQDADSETILTKTIQANTEYDVLATFDETAVLLWVDGELIGTKAFDMDWSQNSQWMQIGGLGWGSASGSSVASNPFDGTISDVMIFDHASTPSDLGLF